MDKKINEEQNEEIVPTRDPIFLWGVGWINFATFMIVGSQSDAIRKGGAFGKDLTRGDGAWVILFAMAIGILLLVVGYLDRRLIRSQLNEDVKAAKKAKKFIATFWFIIVFLLSFQLVQQFLDPGKTAQTLVAKGKSQLSENNIGDAIECFNRAIELNPKLVAALVYRAAARLERESTQDLDNAIVDLNTAIQLEATNGKAYYYRSLAYLRKGNMEQSLADIKTAMRHDASIRELISEDPRFTEKFLEPAKPQAIK